MTTSIERKAIQTSCLAAFVIVSLYSINGLLSEIQEDAITHRRYLNIEHQQTFCTDEHCRPPDPPGVTALGMFRGNARTLCTNNRSLAYLYIPKAGSTTIKTAMEESGHPSEEGFLHPSDGTAITNYNPKIFTVLREPRSRLVSAYSTITNRGGRYALINEVEYYFPSLPQHDADLILWRTHFTQSIKEMMHTIKSFGWKHTPEVDSHYNEHIVPQVDWIRGYNVSHIDCVFNLNHVLETYNLPWPTENNSYEHNETFMPKEKYASYGLLDEDVKALVEELYAEDIAFYESTCLERPKDGSQSQRQRRGKESKAT